MMKNRVNRFVGRMAAWLGVGVGDDVDFDDGGIGQFADGVNDSIP
jgi:hypothetical protein